MCAALQIKCADRPGFFSETATVGDEGRFLLFSHRDDKKWTRFNSKFTEGTAALFR